MSKKQTVGGLIFFSPLILFLFYLVAINGWKALLWIIISLLIGGIIAYGAYLMYGGK